MERSALKKERLLFIVLVLFVAALGVRWVAIMQNEVIANDAVLYIKSAQFYSQGAYAEGFNAFPRSTFPLFIAFAQRFIGDWVKAGQWVSAFFGAMAVIPLYLLARRIFGQKIAILSTIFYIVCPSLVRNSAEVLRDAPFIFFYITALWLGYEGIHEKRPWIMGLAGVFILLSASLKDYGLMLFVSLILFLCWFVVKRKITVRKAIILCAALLASGIVVLAFTGIVLDYRRFSMHTPFLSRAKSALAGIIHERPAMSKLEDEVEESDLSPRGKRLFGIAVDHRFALYSFNIVGKTVRAFDLVLFIFFMFGLIKRYVVPYRFDESLLITVYIAYVPLFFLLLTFATYLQTKNTFPILVPSLIWSGAGFEEFLGKIKRWMEKSWFPFREWGLRRTGLLLTVFVVMIMLFVGLRPQREDKLELKEIGLWLKNNGYAHSIIVGRVELTRLAFYADSELIPIPKGSYRDIVNFAREKKARLLVIDKEVMETVSPDFLGKASSSDLSPIDVGGIKTSENPMRVFRILD